MFVTLQGVLTERNMKKKNHLTSSAYHENDIFMEIIHLANFHRYFVSRGNQEKKVASP